MAKHDRLDTPPLTREEADIRFARWLAAGRLPHSHIGQRRGWCLACGSAPSAPVHRGRRISP